MRVGQLRGGVHYPRSLGEFQAWFATDVDCLDYLEWLRWPDGFICPHCGSPGGWRVADGSYKCVRCKAQTAVVTPATTTRPPSPWGSHPVGDPTFVAVIRIEHDLGASLISLNALIGHRSWSRRLPQYFSSPWQDRHRRRVSFPVDVKFHLLEIGIQAIKPSPSHAGLPDAPPLSPGHSHRFPGMLWSPSPFSIRVSHQAHKPPFEFVPAAPGIQQRASWRTGCARFCCVIRFGLLNRVHPRRRPLAGRHG